MIKAVILDVDGVITGSKLGFNSPIPHRTVIKALKNLRESGIPIILCTAKYYYAILKIITQANLNNPHIADTGALIIDPLHQKIIQKHILTKETAKKIIMTLLKNNLYMEVYGLDKYFIPKGQTTEITEKRTSILQKEPSVIDKIISIVETEDIIKIQAHVRDKEKTEVILQEYTDIITLTWSVPNPRIPFIHVANLTTKGISKLQAVHEVSQNLHIPLHEILGVGDSYSDWEFMQVCGYASAMGNAEEVLKKLVEKKGENQSFIAPHVDENGILDVLKHFKLL